MTVFSLDNSFELLAARIDALGDQPSPAQGDQLAGWIIQNVPMEYWLAAAEDAILIPNVYSEITMRLGEFGR